MHGPVSSHPERIVVLTGAGISAESGVPTFRASDGLWEGHRVEDVATPEAYAADPAVVQAFYDARRAFLADVEPNAAHLALARLEAAYGGRPARRDPERRRPARARRRRAACCTCTASCFGAGAPTATSPPLVGDLCSTVRPARAAGRAALRPDIVWFGEMPYRMDEIEAALIGADLFVSIGTSGAVYPAAGFVQTAGAFGARTLELNLDPSEGTAYFREARHGPASVLVPAWVDDLLA